jgi:hypothetical protein
MPSHTSGETHGLREVTRSLTTRWSRTACRRQPGHCTDTRNTEAGGRDDCQDAKGRYPQRGTGRSVDDAQTTVSENEHAPDSARVLRALAHGIDPVTGEVLDDRSVLALPLVIRALYDGADALESRRPVGARKAGPEGLSKAGAPWTPIEDQELRDAFLKGTAIRDLAIEHQRTQGAISSRLMRLGLMQPATGEPSAR